jgi:hypothetical protein
MGLGGSGSVLYGDQFYRKVADRKVEIPFPLGEGLFLHSPPVECLPCVFTLLPL